MKIQLLVFFSALLAISACPAMLRSARMPVLRAARVPLRNHVRVAHIKARYPLPNARPETELVSRMTREQLVTQLKYQELCWKMHRSDEADSAARNYLKNTTKQLAKSSLKPLIAGFLTYNCPNDIGTNILADAWDEMRLSYEVVQEAVQGCKKVKANKMSVAQELAELVAEQKRKLKVPYDIQ